jgi:TPP-dependent pyruvate/acetoin dehydrogenase alpha subunit
MEAWLKNDQVKRLAALIAPERRAAIDAGIDQDIVEAVRFAELSPFPTAEALYASVFASA